jgi:hypothetical protein
MSSSSSSHRKTRKKTCGDNDDPDGIICKKEDKEEKHELMDYINMIRTKKTVDKHIYNFLKILIRKTNIESKAFEQILRGAFVILQDGGAIYEKFKKYGRLVQHVNYGVAKVYPSSHWSEKTQYRLGRGELFDQRGNKNATFDLLVGTSVLPDFQGHTWFQFENSRIETIAQMVFHVKDFIKYVGSDIGNIGAFGNSPYTELKQKGPLLVEMCYRLENCLFLKDNHPIKNSKKYWKHAKMSIEDYKNLVPTIYSAGTDGQTNMWLRYERTTVPLDKVIEKVVGDNDNDDSLVGISPDILIMEVYKYIFDSA